MSDLMKRYLGQAVTVYYLDQQGHSDKGTLAECDGQFVLLDRKGSGDLLIPLSAVRIIVLPPNTLPIPAGPPEFDSSTLPRPAAEAEDE